MNVLSVHNLAKIGREQPLFTEVSFGLNEGEKAALIGKNGSGKSTLLSIIAGKLHSDEGTVVINKTLEEGRTASYLPQNPIFNPEDTIMDYIFGNDNVKLNTIKKYELTCQKMSEFVDSIPKQFQQEFENLTQEMDNRNLWNYESSIKGILTTLGITNLQAKLKTLSGGMIKKVALAQVLVEDTPLLLLDEPTNHLDIATIKYLEEYLVSTERTVLMVTHDRYFLDSVCTNIFELARGKIKFYQGNYSTYLEKKEIESQIEENTDRRIESVLRTERDWLRRGPCARGTKAKARIDNINRMINREKFTKETGFTFETKERRLGGKVLELKNISKSFDGNCVISNFSYIFNKGQKIGIYGNNGSGKSTLLNIITDKIKADSGEIDLGVNTHIAYYQQNPIFENTKLTVLEYIKETAEVITLNNGKTYSAGQLLEQFDFKGKIQYSPVESLSGGERKRLYLVRLLIANPNFLILDEPTNDFDIFTMSILESFLDGFSGCLLVVSHDRYFMDKVADTLFVMEGNGEISGFVGKCSEYIQFLEEKTREEKLLQKQLAEKEEKQKSLETTEKKPSKKRTFKEQKEFEQLEEDIFTMEDRKSELESLLSDASTDFSKIEEYNREYKEICNSLENKYPRWEELAELLPY
ncbi:MAG: ABC-F family ATP-binding cassette domain-containing protein [Spirochaetaceae bacterium]|nr:ABC-F family ATP-binding cassette domain-containing protein [Spirochaetaceae bacterium]